MYPNTRIAYTENGSGRIENNQQNPENFFNSNEIDRKSVV